MSFQTQGVIFFKSLFKFYFKTKLGLLITKPYCVIDICFVYIHKIKKAKVEKADR